MTVADLTLTDAVIEALADHLTSGDIDDLMDLTAESTTATPEEIRGWWNESTRELHHLSADDRREVLQRSQPFRPHMIDGMAVVLFSAVQVLKGQPRVSAAIVDAGDVRHVVLF